MAAETISAKEGEAHRSEFNNQARKLAASPEKGDAGRWGKLFRDSNILPETAFTDLMKIIGDDKEVKATIKIAVMDDYESKAIEGDQEAILTLRAYATRADDQELLSHITGGVPRIVNTGRPNVEKEALAQFGLTEDQLGEGEALEIGKWVYRQ